MQEKETKYEIYGNCQPRGSAGTVEADIRQDVGSICPASPADCQQAGASIINAQGRVAIPAKPVARAMPKTPHKSAVKAKVKAVKPKRAPMAPTPKPLPKPKPQPQQLTPTQATKQQTQQHQQIAQHLHKEISKANPQHRIYPQPPTPTQKLPTPTVPMTNGYDERDKDELAFHSRAQHPFRTISQTKSTLSGQKRGFQAQNNSAVLNRNRGHDRHSVNGQAGLLKIHRNFY